MGSEECVPAGSKGCDTNGGNLSLVHNMMLEPAQHTDRKLCSIVNSFPNKRSYPIGQMESPLGIDSDSTPAESA